VTLPASVTGGTSTTYNAGNEQTKFDGTSLNYDLNGNLTGYSSNTYTWDARNHLTAMSGGVTASFVYDGFGRRMSKTIGGTITQFLYDGLNPVQELNSSYSVVANLMTGLKIDEYFTRTDSGGNVSTFLGDPLGSTVGLVNSAGSIATSYTYQPFGAITVGGSANGNSYEFAGRENDTTGLYFYRARYYSPTFQRFIAQDPIDFAGCDPNLYGYVFNGPTNFTDPFGFCVGILCLPAPTPIPTPSLEQVLENNSGNYCPAPQPPPPPPPCDLGYGTFAGKVGACLASPLVCPESGPGVAPCIIMAAVNCMSAWSEMLSCH
jgi:RHS repeat-associated protein